MYLTEALAQVRVGGAANWLKLTNDVGGLLPDLLVVAYLTTQIDSWADTYFMAGGYDVPFDVTADAPAILNVVPRLLDIMNYRAKTRGNRKASEDDRKNYEDAMEWLQGVAAGTIRIEGYEGETSAGAAFGFDSEEVLFSRDKLKSY